MRRIVKSIKCYSRAVLDLIVHGVWIPHVYNEEDYEQCIIIATDHSFRVSSSLEHKIGEIVYPNACLIRSYCICCGKEDVSWMPSLEEAMLKLGKSVRRKADE